MEVSIKQVADLYNFNTGLLKHALRGMSEDDAFKRPDENANPIVFILGHMASSRYGVARFFGFNEEDPWKGMFNQGQPVRGRDDYPTMADILEKWDYISEKLSLLLANATEEQLDEPPAFEIPGIEKSCRGNVAFLMFHESYHLGQIGYIRKQLGYDGAVG